MFISPWLRYWNINSVKCGRRERTFIHFELLCEVQLSAMKEKQLLCHLYKQRFSCLEVRQSNHEMQLYSHSLVSMKQDSWNKNLLLSCVGIFFFFSQSWADGPSDLRADLRAAATEHPAVAVHLCLAGGCVKLGRLLMCVTLHNRFCRPKTVRHCCVCGTRDPQVQTHCRPFHRRSPSVGGHLNWNALPIPCCQSIQAV